MYKVKRKESRFWLSMRTERKDAVWIRCIVQKFTKSGNLVVDNCAGTSSVAKACMLLHKHARFIGCEAVSIYVNETMPQLILPNPQRVLLKKFDIDSEERARGSAKIYVRPVEAPAVQKRLDGWEVAEEHSSIHKFPSHMPYRLSTYLGEAELLREARTISIPLERRKASETEYLRRSINLCCRMRIHWYFSEELGGTTY